MFLNTLGYTCDEVINTIQKTKDAVNVVQPDRRCRNIPKHKCSGVDEANIRNHILKYNPNTSHYRREHVPTIRTRCQ